MKARIRPFTPTQLERDLEIFLDVANRAFYRGPDYKWHFGEEFVLGWLSKANVFGVEELSTGCLLGYIAAKVILADDATIAVFCEDFKAVVPEGQGQGLGTRLTLKAIEGLWPRITANTKFLMARTQNGAEGKTALKVSQLLGDGNVVPLTLKPGRQEIAVVNLCLDKIPHLARYGWIDYSRLIHRAGYRDPKNMMENFPPYTGEDLFEKSGISIDRDAGDAVYLCFQIQQPTKRQQPT